MRFQVWHKARVLRGDVRSGKLTLAEFAADLNGVHLGRARLKSEA